MVVQARMNPWMSIFGSASTTSWPSCAHRSAVWATAARQSGWTGSPVNDSFE